MQPLQVLVNSSQQSSTQFDRLIEDLSRTLGPSSGIDSEDVDPHVLQDLMVKYISDEAEWARYAFDDRSRGYTRNLVDRGNGKSNLLILVWTPGKGSPVHDHADSHCIMKILKGRLQETRYGWPGAKNVPLPIKQEAVFHENEVTYMSDSLGVHKISNPDPSQFAVSLHCEFPQKDQYRRAYKEVYTPPNAAKFGCQIFDENTGNSSHIEQCKYFSEFGSKL